MVETKMIVSIEDALQELGASDALLTPREKRALDEQGYVLFENFIDKAWLKALCDGYEGVIKHEGKAAGVDHHQEEGARRIGDLVNKGSVFDGLYTHPKLLAATHYILKRDFKLGALSGRDPLLNGGFQAFHLDTGPRSAASDPYLAVSLMVLLDDFTADNGTTRLLPGSHKGLGPITDRIKDVVAPHPDEIRLIAPAGSVLCFNAQLAHAGCKNTAGTVRRMIHIFYQGREQKPWLDQGEYIRKRTYDRISPAARYILDV